MVAWVHNFEDLEGKQLGSRVFECVLGRSGKPELFEELERIKLPERVSMLVALEFELTSREMSSERCE